MLWLDLIILSITRDGNKGNNIHLLIILKVSLLFKYNSISWDEWVPESRILKYDEENLAKQLDLRDSYTSKKSQEGAAASKKPETAASGTTSNKKRGRDSSVNEKEEDFLKKPEVKIMIPDSLKIQLVNDWENVTKNNKVPFNEYL